MVEVLRDADARDPHTRRLIARAMEGDVEAEQELIAMVAAYHRAEADEIRNARARRDSGEKAEPVLVDMAKAGPPLNGLPEAVHLWAAKYLAARLNPAHRPPDSPDAQHIKRLIVEQYWDLRKHQGLRSKEAALIVRARFLPMAILPSAETIESWGRAAAREAKKAEDAVAGEERDTSGAKYRT